MKYIITENKMNELLITLIKDRYKGIKFHKGPFGIIGVLPDKMKEHLDASDWSLVYEREDEPDSEKMVLWMYQEDFDYFSGMIPLSEKEILKGIKHWFQNKTKAKVDFINIQDR